MILKYELNDNQLVKINQTDYPNHLQDNITLEFYDKTNIINDKTYALIKTHDIVKRVKINNVEGVCSCELPLFVTHQTFFKLRVVVFVGNNLKMMTNELIVPVRVSDYLDYNRGTAHSRKKKFIKHDAIYDEHMNRYDGRWKYPIIPNRVKNV